MIQKSIYPKIASDLFWAQLFWAFGYLGIMLIIHIVKIVLAVVNNVEMKDYFTSVFFSSNIFMLVIGIIASYGFLQYFVSNGATRKDYFKGTVIATIGLSLVIPILTSVITMIERVIFKVMNLQYSDMHLLTDNSMGDTVGDIGDIIGTIIQSVILTPFVDLQSNWFLAIIVFALNIFCYYLIGWLIGAGFYRYGGVLGLAFILIAVGAIFVQDSLLRSVLDLPLNGMVASVEIPFVVAVLGIFVVIGVVLGLIRQLTKRVTIKM